jgi:methyl coenzyme M reductase gamma subunit
MFLSPPRITVWRRLDKSSKTILEIGYGNKPRAFIKGKGINGMATRFDKEGVLKAAGICPQA